MSSPQLFQLFVFIGIMWGIQLLLSYFQQRYFLLQARQLSRLGNVVIGKSRRKIRAGSAVILCISKEGVILSAKCLKGMTMFARLKDLPVLKGRPVHQNFDESTSFAKVIKEALKEAQGVYREKFQHQDYAL